MKKIPDVSRRQAVIQGAAAATAIGLVALLKPSTTHAQTTGNDLAVLKALLTAERNAIKTYEAGKGVIDAATASDPLFAYAGVVTAIALHYRSQHIDHAAKLASYLDAQGGTDDVGPGVAQIPAGFVGNIKNVIDLATNAEREAAVAYTEVQKSIGKTENAELAAAIGAVETQHFVVLNLVARGFVVPPDGTKGKTAAEMSTVASKFAPRSFVVGLSNSLGLDDPNLPYYSVTT
jgi:ferritin-like protein